MSNVTRGLFDPRRKMQHWPEPNDNPNIPYSWGESGLGYSINGYRSNESDSIEPSIKAQFDADYEPEDYEPEDESDSIEPSIKAQLDADYEPEDDIVKPLSTNVKVRGDLNETAVSLAASTSIVLGLWGVVEGYSKSSNQGGERIFDSLEKGVIYATGVGFILCKTMKD